MDKRLQPQAVLCREAALRRHGKEKTARSLLRGARVRLTVFVRPVDGDDCVVRASVHRGALLNHEPEVYRDFFDALDVAMALP